MDVLLPKLTEDAEENHKEPKLKVSVSQPRFFFCILLCFICTSSVLGSFPSIVLHFAFCLCWQRTTHTPMPLAGFFFCVFCTLTVLLCPDCPVFAFCPYYTTHTTQIRTRNPSKRLAAHPRLGPLDHRAQHRTGHMLNKNRKYYDLSQLAGR
jgi:hypothetical protein